MRFRPFGTRLGTSLACAAALLVLTLSVRAQEAVPAPGEPGAQPPPVVPAPSRPVLPATTTGPAAALDPASSQSSAPRPRPRTPPAAAPPSPAPDPMAATLADLRAEIRELRAANDRLGESNGRLTELNGQLRQEVEALALELQAARRDARVRGLLYGAGLILAGLLAGVLIKARPRRSAWS